MTPPERLLVELGITEPREIDVEVIAAMSGARVRYRALGGGDARIIGLGDRAVIAIEERAPVQRQRFSIAHELGHWHHHRGQRLACQGGHEHDRAAATRCEREADHYAADLLMPAFMVTPLLAEPATTALVRRIAAVFRVSLEAAALRLADLHDAAFALIVVPAAGPSWFRRSRALPRQWIVWLGDTADEIDVPPPGRSTTSALRWFRGPGLGGRRVPVDTAPLAGGGYLSIIGSPRPGASVSELRPTGASPPRASPRPPSGHRSG